MEKFKRGKIVMAEGKYKCIVVDIVEEDGTTYYECRPTEFNSFRRFLKEDCLEELAE